MPGILHVVATPIGNLEDITLRAIRILGEVELIAAEDTRRTAKLLRHYKIRTPTTSFHEHNERKKTAHLLERLNRGDSLALVSDAGTPLLSDPGGRLVRTTLGEGIRVEAVPGPSAILAALVTSGFNDCSFTFVGFPPNRSNARKLWFYKLSQQSYPLVIFEAPHRLRASLTDMLAILGDRSVSICRELTKIHEELVVGPISDLLQRLPEKRGEFTLVVAPNSQVSFESPPQPTGQAVFKEFCQLTENGLSRRAAVTAVAIKYGLRSHKAYEMIERGKNK
jgi:16S rRNA (cytidine1402-2'-O)-methyltransferase